ncbi:MAG: serine hydrolase [Anaerolineae bacterium]
MPMMKRSLFVVCFLLFLVPALVFGQTGVYAEAIGQANLRASTDTSSALLGQILSGTRYPVIGRSQFYPWLLLGDISSQQPIGWVFADLVTVYGDLNVVPFSTTIVNPGAVVNTPTLTVPAPAQPTATLSAQVTTVVPTAAPTVPASAVMGIAQGEINIRFGPGVDYPRIGVAQAGDQFVVTGYHTQYPWIQISYAASPNGFGWVSNGLLEVRGDIYSLPAITQTRFILPATTATPQVVQQSLVLGATAVPISPQFQALGDQLWEMILGAGFDPETSTLGALFLMDLQTGEALTFGNDIAFSGMSINKIAILADLYRTLDSPPDSSQAYTVVSAMVCSENTSTNGMLGIIGGGDEVQGAADVTDFMRQLGLQHSFILAPYVIDPNNITPVNIPAPVTTADQTRAAPDGYNQMTVDEIGWMLDSIYQCAYNNTGPLLTAFPGQFDSRECRQMLHVMSFNRIGALIEAGVPAGTRVAHKHGWINDTHGDAAVVFSPGGNYVLVVALHTPTWMDFSISFPLVAEISRNVYNYFNPTTPFASIRNETVPECDMGSNGQIISDLMSFTFAG